MSSPIEVEVVLPPDSEPPRRPPSGTVLSEKAIEDVFELVMRDTRMLSRTALQRPLPVVCQLVKERLPIYRWFVDYRLAKCQLALNEQLATAAPLFADGLREQRSELRQRLDFSRSMLWPTLRTLLLSASVHQRVLAAARTQMLLFAEQPERNRGGGAPLLSPRRLLALWLGLLRSASPRRIVSLWLGLLRSIRYALRWLLVWSGSFFSAHERQRVRTGLIEKALAHGVELQRRVERIEEARRLPMAVAAPRRVERLPSAASAPPGPRELWWRARRRAALLADSLGAGWRRTTERAARPWAES